MNIFSKPLSEVTIEDINELVSNGVGESRTLDYKIEVHGNSDSGKKELLKDLSAFANTVGGCLIYGIEEDAGLPIRVVGVKIDDFDKFKLNYENLLRTGVEPAIRGTEFHSISIGSERSIVIIEVPKSISRPHAVTIKKHFRFYSRNSSGVHPLEVEDLRKAFLASETTAMKIKNFRDDRLSMISVNEGAMPLYNDTLIVLHIIPMNAFEADLKCTFDIDSYLDFVPIRPRGIERKYNFDGLLVYSGDVQNKIAYCYTQVFNNGIIESVSGSVLKPDTDGNKFIPSEAFEVKIVNVVDKYLKSLVKHKIQFPVWICLSLLGIKEYSMFVGPQYDIENNSIDRDELVVSEIQAENNRISAAYLLKPAFDAIWNACGFEYSYNYSEHGIWKNVEIDSVNGAL